MFEAQKEASQGKTSDDLQTNDSTVLFQDRLIYVMIPLSYVKIVIGLDNSNKLTGHRLLKTLNFQLRYLIRLSSSCVRR